MPVCSPLGGVSQTGALPVISSVPATDSPSGSPIAGHPFQQCQLVSFPFGQRKCFPESEGMVSRTPLVFLEVVFRALIDLFFSDDFILGEASILTSVFTFRLNPKVLVPGTVSSSFF